MHPDRVVVFMEPMFVTHGHRNLICGFVDGELEHSTQAEVMRKMQDKARQLQSQDGAGTNL